MVDHGEVHEMTQVVLEIHEVEETPDHGHEMNEDFHEVAKMSVRDHELEEALQIQIHAYHEWE